MQELFDAVNNEIRLRWPSMFSENVISSYPVVIFRIENEMDYSIQTELVNEFEFHVFSKKGTNTDFFEDSLIYRFSDNTINRIKQGGEKVHLNMTHEQRVNHICDTIEYFFKKDPASVPPLPDVYVR